MKVLIINSVCNGSTGHIVQDIARDFITKGDECVIAYGRGNPPQEIPFYKIGSRFSIYFHVFKTRMFDRHGFASKKDTKKFVKWIKNYKPDLIWLHNIHGYYINIDILFNYLRESNVKVKWTLHDCWAFTGHCAYYSSANCEKWKENCHNCLLLKDYPKSFIDYSRNNYIKKKEIFCSLNEKNVQLITPSKWLKGQVEQSFLCKYNIDVSYNCVDTSIFRKVSCNFKSIHKIENKKIILGVASVWDDRKGLIDYINLSNFLSTEYIIVLVGLDEKQISSLKDNNNIIGLKRTSSLYDLVGLYSICDVYFSASTQETFGMTFLEAYHCGCKKIIGYNLTAIPEVLNIVNGYIVEYNDKRLDSVLKIINEEK